MNKTIEDSGSEAATDYPPVMQAEEWAAAPLTEEIVAVIVFNRLNPDKPKLPFPASMYPGFLETTDTKNQTKKFTGTHAQPGAGTLPEFIATASTPVKLPDSTLAELRELNQKIKGLWAQFDDFSLIRAQDFWKSQRAAAGKLGPDGKISDVPVKSLEDLKNEFLTKQRALHDNLEPLIARAKELVRPFFKIVFSALTKELVYLEMGEREKAAQYDVIFVPSYLLRAGWTLLIRLDMENFQGEVFPDKMLATLGIGITL